MDLKLMFAVMAVILAGAIGYGCWKQADCERDGMVAVRGALGGYVCVAGRP